MNINYIVIGGDNVILYRGNDYKKAENIYDKEYIKVIANNSNQRNPFKTVALLKERKPK